MSRLRVLSTFAVLFVILAQPSGSAARGEVEPTGPASVVAGPSRRSLAVEGEYDAVRVPHHADLNPRSALTIELWVKHRIVRNCGTLVGKDRQSSYWFGLCDGRLRFQASGGASADGTAVIPEGRWTHVAISYDGSRHSFYVNGQLDRRTSDGNAPLTANGADLVIGADAMPGVSFRGKIDHLRLWSIARSEQEIQGGRFATLGSQPGLVAEWQLDGNAHDLVGRHDGQIASGGAYSFDGVLPRDLMIPLVSSPVNLDGQCEPSEYGGAERVAVDSLEAPATYVRTDNRDIHVCFEDMPRPRSQNGTAVIYMDRDLGRDDPAQPGDYRLSINMRSTLAADEGDGQGAYKRLDLTAGTWEAVQVTDTDAWSAEFRLPRSFLERPADPEDPYAMGLAFSQSAASGTGGAPFWPVGAEGGRPSTWSTVTLADESGLPPRTTFSGSVQQQLDESDSDGLAGATIQLFLEEKDGVVLADSIPTDTGGRYELEYEGHLPEAFLVREIDPRGATSVSADAGADGDAAGPNLLTYEVARDGPAQSRTYSGALFLDVVGPPIPQLLRQHYLIVYSAPVSEDDLWPIVEAKRHQGFVVVPVSVRDLERTGSGRDLAERIHNWLKAYWETVEPEPVYALLIGRGDRIPVRDVGWMDNDHRDPTRPTYYPAWPTDWYYADVDSEWDADGDGYFGEFMRCQPGDTYPDPEGERDCPEPGSLSREGPFGALRTVDDDFRPEISVGRIAVNEPGEVRRRRAARMTNGARSSPARSGPSRGSHGTQKIGSTCREGTRGPILGFALRGTDRSPTAMTRPSTWTCRSRWC